MDALDQALLEFNRAQPADSPWYTSLDQLSAAQQSRIEQRASEIAQESE
jgi:hypothetical protein